MPYLTECQKIESLIMIRYKDRTQNLNVKVDLLLSNKEIRSIATRHLDAEHTSSDYLVVRLFEEQTFLL